MLLCLLIGGSTARAQHPTTLPPTTRTGEQEVLFNEGLLRFYGGDFAGADPHFRALLAQNPWDIDARYYVGLTLSNRGLPLPAIETFDQVLAMDPAFKSARLARTAARVRARQYDAAEAELAEMEQDPELRASALALRGQMLYDQGRYAEAAEALEAARAAGANDADLLQGLAYYRAGDVRRSRAALERASGLSGDPYVVSASRQLEAAIGARRGRRPLEFELSAGYEYDTNVSLLEDGAVLPEDISRREDGRFVLEPRVRWNAIRTDRATAGLSTSNYFSFQSRLGDFDITSLQGGPFVNYRVNDNVVAGLRYDFNYVELGHDPFLQRHVVTPDVTFYERGFGYTGLFFQYDARQYESEAGQGALDRDGDVWSVGAIQSIDLPEFFDGQGRAELQLMGRFRNQQTRGADFDGNLFDGSATLFVPLPGKLIWDIGVHAGLEDYDNPNSLDFDRDARRDVEVGFTTGVMRQINDWLSVRAEYLFTDHDSNVETSDNVSPYEFSSHVVGVRMLITF